MPGFAITLAVGLPLHAQPNPRPSPAPAAARLFEIEQLPVARAAERLARLQSLPVQAGSLEALERLFLLATTDGAPPLAQADWRAWEAAADARWLTLGTMVQALVDLHRLVAADRIRDAVAAAQAMPPLAPQWSPLWRARALLLQARALGTKGDHEASLLLRLQAVPLLESLGVPWRLSSALSALAVNYSRVGQHERALPAAQEGLRLAGQTQDLALQARAGNLLAVTHTIAGRYEASRVEGEWALAKARQAGEPRLLALLLSNVSDAYLNRGDPARAFKLADEAYVLAHKLGAKTALAVAQNNRGLALIQLGQVAKGRSDIQSAAALSLQRGSTASAANGMRDLGLALERVGDLPGAYDAFTQERELLEAKTRKDRREALGQAQSAFDAAQREREAEKLRQQTALQAETIRSQWLRFGLIALVLISGLAVLFVVGWFLRKLRRTNRDLAALNRDLAARSELDPLTGLGNRRRWQRLALNTASAETPRVGLLLLDIDHFKQINDRYGHLAGDLVLTAVAGRLRKAVPDAEGLMRWGGEEFLVLLPGADGPSTTALAQHLLDALAREPISLRDGRSLRLTVSIGALALPLGTLALHAEQGVQVADALMYGAKTHGRNQAWCLEDAQVQSLAALMDLLANTDAPSAALRLQRRAGVRA